MGSLLPSALRRVHAGACALLLCAPWTPAAVAQEVALSVSGDYPVLTDRLNAASGLRDAVPADPQEVLAAARADYARLLGTLFAEGYYAATVSIRLDGREAADVPALARLGPVSRVEIAVVPGARFTFGQAAIGPLAPGTVLPPGFAPGQPATLAPIREAAAAGVSGWRDAGHAKAAVTGQSLTADHRSARMAARLTVTPGPVLRFGALDVPQDSAVRAARIRAIAGLPTGETFSPQAIEDAARRLRQSGAFSTVALSEAEAANPDGTLDIGLTLVDAAPRRIGAGGELSSTEGLTLSGFWLHRNLFGGAERLRFDGTVSDLLSARNGNGIDAGLTGRFTRPATFDADTALYVEGDLEWVQEPAYDSLGFEMAVGLERRFDETLTGEFGIGLRVQRKDDATGSRTFRQLTFPIALTRDRRDPANDPRGGDYLALDAVPFVGLGGDASGLRYSLDARLYRALGERLVFAARGQVGGVIGPALADIRPDDLFLSGGGGTVRGQPYQGLGITGAGGSGGAGFLGASAELRARVTDRFGFVAFTDIGFVSETAGFGGRTATHAGAGLGLRYDTGLGPIRVDVGVPVSGPGGDGAQLYIGIGQAF